MNRGNKHKMPKIGAKRFGWKSTTTKGTTGSANKNLHKSGYYQNWIERAKKYLNIED